MEEVKQQRRGGRPKMYETPEELTEHNTEYHKTYYHEKLKGDIACLYCGTLSSTMLIITFNRNRRHSLLLVSRDKSYIYCYFLEHNAYTSY